MSSKEKQNGVSSDRTSSSKLAGEAEDGQQQNYDLVHRLRRLDCCAVSDALDSLKLSGYAHGITRLSTGLRIAGRVVTVELVPSEVAKQYVPHKTVQHLGTEAVELASTNDVIVIKQAPESQAGSWGGILSLGASLRGVAGVISDGLVRDIDEAREYSLPVFAKGVTAMTARGRVQQLQTNGPIQVQGVAVNFGDLVIADGSGVVFINAYHAERVIAVAERIAAKEAHMNKALLSGDPISKVMGADYEFLLN